MKKYLGFFIVLTLLVLGANYAQATTNVPVVTYSSTEASSIIVLSPNGGEVVNISKPVTVTFKSNNPAPAKHYINLVDVNTDHAYSLDSLLGSNGLILTQEQINQSTQSITVSAPESIKLDTTHNYLIEICVNNICDKSDSTFKITSTVLPLTQIYPTGCNSAVGFSSTTGLPCFLDTNPATSITKSSAVLNGRIFANTPANLYFNYKKAGNGNEMFTTPAIYQQDNGSFSYTLPGLISNTKYEFKVCMPYANLANTCSKLINFTTSASYIDEVIVNPTETGCSNSEKYSSTTGMICSVVIENGCNGTAYSTTTGQVCSGGTNLISYWYGKVNQHISNVADTNKSWVTDPDGVSGADLDMLTYCKKWYPNTTSVVPFKNQTLDSWKDAGNVGAYKSTRMAYSCVQGIVDQTSSIKVNSPNGGQNYKIGDTMEINWSTYNAPINSWILLEINGGGRLIEQKIKTSQNHYSWVIPASFSGYNDYPIELLPGTNYKITAKLLTGINGYCDGLPNPQAPCMTNPPILISSDSSDNTFSINSTGIGNGCSNGEIYSSTTGKICPVVIENGCNGTVYSTTTGQKCNYVVIDPPCSSNEINCYPNKTTVITSPITRTLKIGVKGEDVKTLQSFFKITADGVFGKMTAAKVMEWQKLNGLTADGLFGVKSLQKANIIQ